MPRTWTLTVIADHEDDYENVQDRMFNFRHSIGRLLDTGGNTRLEWRTDEDADPSTWVSDFDTLRAIPPVTTPCINCGHTTSHGPDGRGICRLDCLCHNRNTNDELERRARLDTVIATVEDTRCTRCGHSEPHDLGAYGFCQRYGCVCSRTDIEAHEWSGGSTVSAEERRAGENRLAAQRQEMLEMLTEPEQDEHECETCHHYPHSSGACNVSHCFCIRDASVPEEVRAVAPAETAEDIEAWIASL